MSSTAVIGLGRFGRSLAKALAFMGSDVVAIDSNMEAVEDIKNMVSRALCLDSTDEEALKAAGIADVDAAVVAISHSWEVSIITTALLKKLGVSRIISRSTSELHSRILTMVGATKVVDPEDQMGHIMARTLVSPQLMDVVPLAGGFMVAEMEAKSVIVGKTVAALDLRKRFGLNIVAIRQSRLIVDARGEERVKDKVSNLPTPDQVIEKGDILVLIGTPEGIEEFNRMGSRG